MSRGKPLSADDPRHGSVTGYRWHGCRCDPCRIAASAYQKMHRARSGLEPSNAIYRKAEHRAAAWVRELHRDVWDRIVGQLYAEADDDR